MCVYTITFSADIIVRGAGFGVGTGTGEGAGVGVFSFSPSEPFVCISLTEACASVPLGFSMTASLQEKEVDKKEI